MQQLLFTTALALALTACSEPTPGPAVAATNFVAGLRLAETEAGRRETFEALSREAQEALRARADAAGAAAGAEVQPWDVFRFGGLVAGDRVVSAEVVQASADAATVRMRLARYYGAPRRGPGAGRAVASAAVDAATVEVPLVRQEGRWRVALAVPGAPPEETP